MHGQSEECWHVYIVRTVSGKLYTGIARSAALRFEQHLTDRKLGAKFFRSDLPETIVYAEEQPDRARASQREYAIKQLTREQKLSLIASLAEQA